MAEKLEKGRYGRVTDWSSVNRSCAPNYRKYGCAECGQPSEVMVQYHDETGRPVPVGSVFFCEQHAPR